CTPEVCCVFADSERLRCPIPLRERTQRGKRGCVRRERDDVPGGITSDGAQRIGFECGEHFGGSLNEHAAVDLETRGDFAADTLCDAYWRCRRRCEDRIAAVEHRAHVRVAELAEQ